MSNIYIQEPPTQGKVLLETSVGDIEVELWSRECPKACRNFVQLCMENYYAKTKFHRVVKDFIVQGGDPSGTGRGGDSVYGTPFKDEFHSRLRFCRRGLVAMANSGKDDNGSQFFFTMGPTQELQNKHTIFGKVVGDTIYNMLRLQEGICEDESPINPHKIVRTEVLINPFKDIQPRETIELIKDEEGGGSKAKKKKSKMKATKDYKLLSFGDEAEDEEDDLNSALKTTSAATSSKSAHDLLNDPKLSKDVGDEFKNSAVDADKKKKRKTSKNDDDNETRRTEEVDEDSQAKEDKVSAIRDKLKKAKPTSSKHDGDGAKKNDVTSKKRQANDDVTMSDEDVDEMEKKRDEIRREIKQLQKEMSRKSQKPEAAAAGDSKGREKSSKKLTEEEKSNDMLREFHAEQEKAKKAKVVPKKGSSAREAQTLAMLAKFQQKLQGCATTDKDDDDNASDVTSKKREAIDDVDNDDDEDLKGDSWMSNTLKFGSDDPILAKDANTKDDNWFDIYDPRNPLNKRRRENDSKRSKRK